MQIYAKNVDAELVVAGLELAAAARRVARRIAMTPPGTTEVEKEARVTPDVENFARAGDQLHTAWAKVAARYAIPASDWPRGKLKEEPGHDSKG